MNDHIGKTCLITLSFLFAAGVAQANPQKSDATAKPATSSQTAKAGNKGNSSKTIKAVDINSASKAELKTLPGIDDALAEKIIAGRPYPSKGFLVSRKIIPEGLYVQIKKQIIAMQK
jgi:DNA uptake protein ComE-like DNA-binding protein